MDTYTEEIMKAAIKDIAEAAKQALKIDVNHWIDTNEQEPVYGESVLLLFQNGDVVVGYKADRRYYPAYGAFRKEWREIRYWCRIPDYSHLILGFPGR